MLVLLEVVLLQSSVLSLLHAIACKADPALVGCYGIAS